MSHTEKSATRKLNSIFLFDVWLSILVCFLLFSESIFFFFFPHMRSVSGQRLSVDIISLRNIKFQLLLIQLWCDIQRLTRNKFISELNPTVNTWSLPAAFALHPHINKANPHANNFLYILFYLLIIYSLYHRQSANTFHHSPYK